MSTSYNQILKRVSILKGRCHLLDLEMPDMTIDYKYKTNIQLLSFEVLR